MPKTISIIIPAYNETDRLGSTFRALASTKLPKGHSLAEVVVVDDGSTDSTVQIAKTYKEKLPIKIISLPANHGKGAAVKRGMLGARGDYRLFMDADNSVDVRRYLKPFLAQLAGGYQVVIASIGLTGSLVEDRDARRYRRLFGLLSRWGISNFIVPGIADTQRGFKFFSGQAADLIFPKQVVAGYAFDIEILTIAQQNRLKVKEIGVSWQNQPGSKVSPRDYLPTLAAMIRIYKNRRRGIYRAKVKDWRPEPEASWLN